MPPAIGLIAPVLKVGGVALSDAILSTLTYAEVDRAVNLVGRATLKFMGSGFELAAQPKFELGTPVEIGVTSSSTTLFKGDVTGISIDQVGSGDYLLSDQTELTVTVDDKAYKLGQTTKNTAFVQQGLTDVISQMASAAGLSAEVVSVDGGAEYLLQSGTDLAYLDWVAARFGLLWFVDGAKLKVVKYGTSSGTTTVKLGDDLTRLSSRASGRHPGKVTVTGWDESQQAAISGSASTTKSTESTLVSKYPGRTGSSAEIAVPAWPLSNTEASDVSSGMLDQATSAAVTTRGVTVEPKADLKPASQVKIENAGPVSGTYYVTRVQHVYDNRGFQTRFTAGPIRPDSIVDLLGPPPAPPGTQITGLVVGIVTNVKDDKKWGRVKVKFPTLGTGVESAWARVVTIGGGPQRGAVFAPEVSDEVLVGFEQGDTRRPVVIGGLFSDKNKLPSTDNIASGGEVAYRRITSRLGHIIELADGTSPDKKHLLLKTSNGHQIRIGEDEMTLEVKDKPIKITNGNATISFANTGDITIEGINISIKADGAIKMEAKSGIEIKTNASAKIEGAMLNVKSQGMGTVEAGGILALKGASVAIN